MNKNASKRTDGFQLLLQALVQKPTAKSANDQSPWHIPIRPQGAIGPPLANLNIIGNSWAMKSKEEQADICFSHSADPHSQAL